MLIVTELCYQNQMKNYSYGFIFLALVYLIFFVIFNEKYIFDFFCLIKGYHINHFDL